MLLNLCRKKFGADYKDRFKEEEKSSAILAHLVAPFNPDYMRYNTTRNYNQIFWGAGRKLQVLAREWWTFKTRAHEGQHMVDWSWLKWIYGLPHLLFLALLIPFFIYGKLWALACFGMLVAGLGLGYLWPRKKAWFFTWTALGMGACIGIGVWKVPWSMLWLGAGALCASPLLNWIGAAAGRAIGEIRGYTVSMACNYWRYGSVQQSTIDWIVKQFVGGSYYFMLPWKSIITKVLNRQIKKIEDGRILKNPWAAEVHSIMRDTGIAPERY